MWGVRKNQEEKKRRRFGLHASRTANATRCRSPFDRHLKWSKNWKERFKFYWYAQLRGRICRSEYENSMYHTLYGHSEQRSRMVIRQCDHAHSLVQPYAHCQSAGIPHTITILSTLACAVADRTHSVWTHTHCRDWQNKPTGSGFQFQSSSFPVRCEWAAEEDNDIIIIAHRFQSHAHGPLFLLSKLSKQTHRGTLN